MMSPRCMAFTALAATLSAMSWSPRLLRRVTATATTSLFVISGAMMTSRGFTHASALSSPSSSTGSSYLDAATAKAIDEELMGESGGFQLEQLMELAGLSVASAAQDLLCSKNVVDVKDCDAGKRILIICGPGNNGGDGLVAARHLCHLGHKPTILYPKQGKNPFFSQLCTQCINLGIPIVQSISSQEKELQEYDLVIDAMFGFSFKGPIRDPYGKYLTDLMRSNAEGNGPIVLSVDIPSGWSVEDGDIYDTGFSPAAVISLTAPKLCMKKYEGVHYLGGRFVPDGMKRKYNLSLPHYDTNTLTQLYKYPSSTSPPTSNPISPEWVLYLTAEGYPYYYHPSSGESRWAAFTPTLHSPSQSTDKYKPDDNYQIYTQDLQDGLSAELTKALESGHMIENYSAEKANELAEQSEISMYVSTTGDVAEAKRLANHLVKNRLAACVNIVPGVVSVYEWEGQLEESTEAMMIIKTRRSLADRVTSSLKSLHSYDVPEGIVLDISTNRGKTLGNPDYIKWVREQTISKDDTD